MKWIHRSDSCPRVRSSMRECEADGTSVEQHTTISMRQEGVLRLCLTCLHRLLASTHTWPGNAVVFAKEVCEHCDPTGIPCGAEHK